MSKKRLLKGLKKSQLEIQKRGCANGGLAGKDQLADVQSKVELLSSCCDLVLGGDDFEVIGGSRDKGAFMMPHLFTCAKGLTATTPHEVEAFGLSAR